MGVMTNMSPVSGDALSRNDVPLVSVAIPLYRCAATIGETLDSVLAQSYPNLEIIVVDDGSPDDSSAVLRRFEGRVRYIRQPNGGVGSARNRGLSEARGEYIALLDCDDLCEPDRIAIQVSYLQQNPDVLLCSSDFTFFGEGVESQGSSIGEYYSSVGDCPDGVAGLYGSSDMLDLSGVRRVTADGPDQVRTLSGDIFEKLVWGNFVHPPTIMMRREAARIVGEFNPRFRYVTEYEWMLRASRHGRIGYIDRPLLRYRLSRGQLSGDCNTGPLKKDTIELLRALQRDDPQFCRAHAGRLRKRFALLNLHVADEMIDLNRMEAWRYWFRGVAKGGHGVYTLKILVKLFVPLGLLKLRRAVRRARGSSVPISH